MLAQRQDDPFCFVGAKYGLNVRRYRPGQGVSLRSCFVDREADDPMTWETHIAGFNILHDRAEGLASFGVGDVGGEAEFLVCLDEEFLGARCVSAKLAVVIGLSGADRLVGGDDGLLRAPQIAVVVADVDDRGLSEGKDGSPEDDCG